jgi:hypothetical protein
MDNQHKHIKGYRDLDEHEIALINQLKQAEANAGMVIAQLNDLCQAVSDVEAARWVSIARTHLETGFMYAIKAVARPTNGLGRKNPE